MNHLMQRNDLLKLGQIVRGVRVAAVALMVMGMAGPSVAQDYPSKPIRLVLPYPPGGGTDIVARLLASKIQQQLGQPVMVENKPGASTVIGTDAVAKAPADGYTIGLVTDSHVLNPLFMAKLPYDAFKDFQPVSQLTFVPLMLVANPKLNVKSVSDFVTLARSRPGKLSYASIGEGTPHHIAMEWLKLMAKIDPLHVPYKGVGPALNDVVGGQVDVMFTGTSTAKPFIDTGRLVPLAISSAKRQPSFPDIPAVSEAGVSGYEFVTWYGIVAPAGTPAQITTRLSEEISTAMAQPDVRDRLVSLGVVPATSTPVEFGDFLRREKEKFERIIKTTGIKLE